MLIIAYIILSAALLGCVAAYIYCSFKMRYWSGIGERNEEVYKFRIDMLHSDPELFHSLPSYDEMVFDKKPLTKENYSKPITGGKE